MTENQNLANRPMISAQDVNPISMMFDPVISERCLAIAETLARGRISTPRHLRGNVGDCLAIVMQSASWRLNPFAVAQKTYLVHGRLAYEAQLMSAVMNSLRIIDGRFSYEYIGDWDRLAVPPIIQKSAEGFDIPTPGWKSEHETGLAVIVSAKIRGDEDVKKHKLTLASVWPRNSTLWATNARQQASYLVTKQWARLYAPDAILGVYTVDELEQQSERVVTGERVTENTTEAIMADARKAGDAKPAEFSDDWFKEEIVNATTILELNDIRETMSDCDSETTELISLWEKRIAEIGSKQKDQQESTGQDQQSERSENKKSEWPKKVDGYLIDARNVIWDGRIHSSGQVCTQEDHWRRKRGMMPSRVKELERTIDQIRKERASRMPHKPSTDSHEESKNSAQQKEQKPASETQPEIFSEEWFLTKISEVATEEDLDEYEDLIDEVELHPEVKTGIEHKIAARRAELQQTEMSL